MTPNELFKSLRDQDVTFFVENPEEYDEIADSNNFGEGTWYYFDEELTEEKLKHWSTTDDFFIILPSYPFLESVKKLFPEYENFEYGKL